MMRKGE